MKKIVIAAIMSCLVSSMFAQQKLPFVTFKPVQAQPVQVTPPTLPRNSDPMDPLGLGRRSSVQTPSFSAQKEHFGLILGSRYNTGEIEKMFKFYYEDNAYSLGDDHIFETTVVYQYSKEGEPFSGWTMFFYNGRFWKIIYRNIKSEPNAFANKLEKKLIEYSISETEYEYQCGDIYIKFDGKDLSYVSESVTKAIAGY